MMFLNLFNNGVRQFSKRYFFTNSKSGLIIPSRKKIRPVRTLDSFAGLSDISDFDLETQDDLHDILDSKISPLLASDSGHLLQYFNVLIILSSYLIGIYEKQSFSKAS